MTYPSGGGKACDAHLKQIQACNEDVCDAPEVPPPVAVDCVLGVFSDWTACSKSCGSGLQTRTRQIITAPKHGGAACDGALKEVQGCADFECPPEEPEEPEAPKTIIDCEWGEWDNWSACSASCDGGEKTRIREI